MALKVGELFASFGIDSSGVNGALKSIEQSISDMGKRLSLAGGAWTLTVTNGIVKAGKSIYSAGSSFEKQMSAVAAISGATGDDLERLTQAAIDMGSTSAFTATEAGQAMQYMAMAGWKTEAMLDGLAPIMDLAAASGEDLATVSDIVTDALTAFGLTAEDAGEFSNVLAATATNSNTNVGMLGESFKYVAAVAGSFGYSIDDVAQALGIMANSGIKSTMAGTSLRNMMTNMLSPTDEMAEAMDYLGLSLYDSRGQLKPWGEVMSDMRKAAKRAGVDLNAMQAEVAKLDLQFQNGEISEADYEAQLAEVTAGSSDFMQAVNALAGKRGLPGMLAIMNASDEDWDALAGAIYNAEGAASSMADTKLDNVAGSVTLLKSAVEGLEITLYNLYSDTFKGVIDRMTAVVDSFRQLDSETQKAVMRFGAIAAAAGPVMTVAGGLMTVLPKLARGLMMINAPMGLIAVGAAAIGLAFGNDDNSIGTLIEAAAERAGKGLEDLRQKMNKDLPRIAKNMRTMLTSIVKSIKAALPNLINLISDGIVNFADLISVNSEHIAEVGRTLITTIASGFRTNAPKLIPSLVQLMGNLFASAVNSIPSIIQAGLDLLSGLLEGIKATDWSRLKTVLWSSIKMAFSKSGDVIAEWLGIENYATMAEGEKWGAIATTIWDKIKSGFTDLGDWLADALKIDGYEAGSNNWSAIATAVWSSIKKGFTGLGDWLADVLEIDGYVAGSNDWSAIAKTAWEKIKSGFTQVGDWLAGAMGIQGYKAGQGWLFVGREILAKIKIGIGKFQTWFTSWLGISGWTAEDGYEAIGEAIWNKIKDGIKVASDWLKDLLFPAGENGKIDVGDWSTVASNIVEKLTTFLTGAHLMEFATGLINGISDSLKTATEGGEMDSGLSTAFGAIVDGITSGLEKTIKAATGLATSILEAIASLITPENVQKVFEGLTAVGTELFNGLLEIVTQVINGISTVLSDEGTLAQIREGLTAMITGFFGLINNLLSSDRLPQLITSIEGLIKSAIGAISDVLGDKELVKSLFDGVGNLLVGVFNMFTDVLGDESTLSNLFSSIGDFVQSVIEGIGDVIGKLATEVDWSETGEGFGKTVADLLNGIFEMLSKINITDLLHNVGLLAKSIITGLLEAIKSLFTNLDENDVEGAISNLISEAINAAVTTSFDVADIVGTIVGWLLDPENFTAIFNAAFALGTGILDGIVDGFSDIGSSLGTIFDKALRSVLGDTVTDTIEDFLGINIEKTVENADVTPAAQAFMRKNLGGVDYSISGDEVEEYKRYQDEIREEYGSLLEGEGAVLLQDWFIQHSDQTKIAEKAKSDWMEAMFGIDTETYSEALNALASFGDDWSRTIETWNGTKMVKTTVGDIYEEMGFTKETFESLREYQNFVEAFGDFEFTMPDSIPTSITSFEELANYLLEYNKTAQETTDVVTESTAELTAAEKAYAEIMQEMGFDTSTEVGEGTADGITAATPTIQDAIDLMGETVVLEIMHHMSYEQGYQMGFDLVSGVPAGFVVAQPEAVAAATEAGNAVNGALKAALTYDKGYSFGSNVARGLYQGIIDGIALVTRAATMLADAVKNAISGTLQIHSPSRVTSYFGEMIDEGMVVGVEANANTVKKTVNAMLNDTLSETHQIASSYDMAGDWGAILTNASDGIEETSRDFAVMFADGARALEDAGSSFDFGSIAAKFGNAGIEAGKAFAEQSTKYKGGGGGGSGSSANVPTQNYTDYSSFNIQQVRVQGMDDIEALSAEIAAARRRRMFGYGS